jgi:urease accessory protein
MNKLSFAGAIALATTFSTSAFAHHPMAGETPTTLGQGLLSGIGHPILGLDHLAFIVAVGIAAFAIGARFALPAFFIIATLAGTGIHLMAIDLPMVEFVVSLSVAAAGLMLISGKKIPFAAYAALFALAGLFHGHAYGEAIFGAEATPVVAYLAGFGLTQYAIAIVAGTAIVTVLGKANDLIANVPARIGGGMVAGAGLLLVGEKAINAAFGIA